MPALNEDNVRHLLRRTEFVDRQSRVDELLALADIGAAVDNIMATPANPPSVSFTAPANEDWRRGQELVHFWLDRMAHDSSRPFQERMSFFWHGHICSELGKVGSAELMREQIDVFRRDGLGNMRQMVKDISLQVAMLRYLDNNQNRRSSPNQNFARELMELFLLEVGNYTEADVEAATAAWTGHTDDWETDQYVWHGPPAYVQVWDNWHDNSTKQFLGRTINTDKSNHAQQHVHAFETIDVILGDGIVPSGADKVANRGRPTRDVAAEFVSKKLWAELAGSDIPGGVLGTLRSTLVGANFDVRPWVRALLVHDEFYSNTVKNGLVRQPTEYVVALLVATGLRSEDGSATWLMERAGQVPLYPPNVSGWRPNGYWVNASAMEARNRIAQGFTYPIFAPYWVHPWENRHLNYLQFGGGSDPSLRIYQDEVVGDGDTTPITSGALVDRMLQYMDLSLSASARSTIISYLDSIEIWERPDALLLILLTPEMHVA